ncbi:hypothetical protein JOF28_001099 [Leucobacter exalbidus]|uniref:Prevent-host-death protein n=1 Tax=Leucobacter exalbidus TaxID=662960 RepID=A0A940PL04_9MICO|nr:prevent-host-death protein [Leucobacter exalbidus]MBP1325867.1 hypothetical protein [Leucobacter exalbidus]
MSHPLLARQQFRSSELSRNSSEVFAAAQEHPIVVTRRDAESLVLMSEREADSKQQLFEFASQLIAVTTSDAGSLADRMADRFPWMLALSASDRAQCAQDLVSAARASFATEQPHLAIAELTSWKESATLIAAGLGGSTVDWLNDPASAERP